MCSCQMEPTLLRGTIGRLTNVPVLSTHSAIDTDREKTNPSRDIRNKLLVVKQEIKLGGKL